ncbi:carbohydrate-binding protein [Rhizomonospora bruguierae]|uniref:carbohydrate-binding protein n=1 Tax=Rhizomonospora bruguierae TaxID=1581705 RepID=UPI001BCC0F56|nr:carbohydrate-binding protein [Micromonospora sp. NBRC 107566]
MRRALRKPKALSLAFAVSLSLVGLGTPATAAVPTDRLHTGRNALAGGAAATEYLGYQSLDNGAEQIGFDGTEVTWNGKVWTLDESTIFIDYRLDRTQLAGNPHAFTSLQDAKAAGAVHDGTIDKRMTVLMAPGVYWIDDPDDGFIRPDRPSDNPEEGLYGMTINADWLHIQGLTGNKSNVVFAAARGQQQGSDGNFNLFRFTSTGLLTENVTFGNYVNVDLSFPLDGKLPAGERLSRPKRFDAISQAQLFGGSSVSKAVAVNTAFVSRLNLLPFTALYIDCYVESSGHAGGGSTYINSSLHLYNTNFSGGTQFYNSDIYLDPLPVNTSGKTVYEQGFGDSTSTSGVAIDTRFHRGPSLTENPVTPDMPAGVSWSTRTPKNPTTRSYQYNVTLDGEPYVIQDHFTPGSSVVIPGDSELLKAYRVEHDGTVYYNLQNILGLDNFDGANAVYLPYGHVEAIAAAEAAEGVADGFYRTVPRAASLARDGGATPIHNGGTPATFTASAEAGRSGGLGAWTFEAYDYVPDQAAAIDPATRKYRPATYVELRADGNRVEVSSTLTGYEQKQVLIVARNALGIEAAALATVQPPYIDAPVFTAGGEPTIVIGADGKARLDYDFQVKGDGLLDTSVISWFRVRSADDPNPLPLVTSRLNKPERVYPIGEGDVGSSLMAMITPRYNVSEPAATTTVVTSGRDIAKGDVAVAMNAAGNEVSRVTTDFNNMPTDVQPRIIPGTWTLTNGAGGSGWIWADGSTTQGSAGFSGLQTGSPDRESRLHYQPVGEAFGDVTLTVKLAPNKTAGQGFGSAPDFLDLYIKSDGVRLDMITRGEPGAMNGYALRFQRLAAPEISELGFNPGGAVAGVAVYLVKITDGRDSAVRYDSANRPFGSTLPQLMWDPENPDVKYTRGAMISAYLTELTVKLSLVDGKLAADVSASADARPGDDFGYLRQVRLAADVDMSDLGGVGMYYSSSTGSDNSTVLTRWESEIEKRVPGWSATAVYVAGDTVTYQGSAWQALWWTQNQEPGDPYGPWQEIAATADGTPIWTATRIFTAGAVVVYQGRKYVAQWWTRNQAPGIPYGPWTLAG